MAWKRLIFLFFFITSFVEAKDFNLQKIISFDEPWGSTFINDNELLITEKSGKIKLLNIINNNISEIDHNLKVLAYGQGGLLDIIFHNDYVWVSYTEKRENWETSTSIAKGLFNKSKINFENIFQAFPPIDSPYHFGSRLAIKDDYLFASVGERGKGMIAQDFTKHPGSIIRIYLDGSIPKDNPKFKNKNINLFHAME